MSAEEYLTEQGFWTYAGKIHISPDSLMEMLESYAQQARKEGFEAGREEKGTDDIELGLVEMKYPEFKDYEESLKK